MGRVYSIPFKKVAVAAAQDLFSYKAAAGKPFILHEIVVGQSSRYGDANAAGLSITISRATGSYTAGSGGTTPTPAPSQTSDTAAGGTTHANDTTRAVAGSGAITLLRADAFNEQGGWPYLPTPETRYWFMPTEAVIVSLEDTPAASCTMSGTMVIEELG